MPYIKQYFSLPYKSKETYKNAMKVGILNLLSRDDIHKMVVIRKQSTIIKDITFYRKTKFIVQFFIKNTWQFPKYGNEYENMLEIFALSSKENKKNILITALNSVKVYKNQIYSCQSWHYFFPLIQRIVPLRWLPRASLNFCLK